MREQALDQALQEPPIRLWRRMVRLTEAKRREAELQLSPLGLSGTEFDLLAVVRSLGSASQQQVAQRLLFSEPNVSYHTKRLMGRGLLERVTAGKEKRLSLTPAGHHLILQALPVIVELHREQFSGLSPEEQALLTSLLRRLK